ncbi:hypothetical protein [Serinibacter arcticus]|uniref:hypothetical protein n=1 Tax=Serinibacter arcticus TaxID=1655435 RepID=UPI0011B23CB7|nr:hypothetical protein [Serinibacter arcticus]
MSPNRVRVVRGAVAGGVSVGLALLFHLAGGGAAPGALGLAAPLVLASLAATALTSRARLGTTLAATTIGQVAFHTLFTLGAAPVATSATAGHGSHAAHADPSAALQHATAGADATHAVVGVHGDARMWAMHLVAAAVTAVVLHHGELALAHLAGLAVRVAHAVGLGRRPAAPLAAPVVLLATAAPVDGERPRAWTDHLVSTSPRRGPPVGLAA